LNALVMIAVKRKSRLRAHKSNILLALLASIDFTVGVFIAVLVMFLLDEPNGYCVLRVLFPFMSCLVVASLFHLALIAGERYLAMKHPFAHLTIVTEARLLIVSMWAWLLSVSLHIPFALDKRAFMGITNTFVSITVASIVFCHVTVYRETRRHEKQIADQQVTEDAREQFQYNKKALKLTSTILGVLALCYMPLFVSTVVTVRFRSKLSQETVYIFFFSAFSIVLLNSLFNPIIYATRMRQFRLMFIELTCRIVNIAEAEEIEMRVFRASSAVGRLKAEQQHEGQDQQNEKQVNVNKSGNHNNGLPQHDNCIADGTGEEQLSFTV